MKQKMKRFFCILLSLELVLTLMLDTGMQVYAATDTYTDLIPSDSDDENALTDKVVKFNGLDWYIIADDSSAVDRGTVTLLAKNPVGASKFNATTGDGSQYNDSNSGNSSVVKEYLDALTAENGSFANVENVIASTDLSDVGAGGVKLYLLSTDETKKLPVSIRKCTKADGAAGNAWWLRSAGFDSRSAAYVAGDTGRIAADGYPVPYVLGVRPALRLNLSSVIFTSVNLSGGANSIASGDSSIKNVFRLNNASIGPMTTITYTACEGYVFPETSGCYTTTNGITVTRTSDTVVTVSGTPSGVADIVVPDAVTSVAAPTAPAISSITGAKLIYGYTGGSVTVTAATEPENSLSYQWYSNNTNSNTGGTLLGSGAEGASYTIPTGKNAGTTEYYYCVVTAVSMDNNETASATSDVATVTIGKAPLIITANPKTITYGDAPSNDGVTYSGFVNDETENVLNGTLSYTYSYSQNDEAGSYTIMPGGLISDNYDITFKPGILTVNKSSIPAGDLIPPTAKTGLSYTAAAQELINPGAVTCGTMYYALGTNASAAPEASAYTTSIPTAADAGTYYVWYKAVGNENTMDTEPACVIAEISMPVEISATVTFKVVNGAWNDGNTADKTVTLTGTESGTLKLSTDQIPLAGMKPAENYREGSWDIIPSADTEITGNMTYTYTYASKNAAEVIKAPTAKTLTANGSAQELVMAGEAKNGTIYYAVTENEQAPEASDYTTAIPTGINEGTYYVWSKAVGDAEHTDSVAAGICCTISKSNEQPAPSPEEPTPSPEEPTPSPEEPTPSPEGPTPSSETPMAIVDENGKIRVYINGVEDNSYEGLAKQQGAGSNEAQYIYVKNGEKVNDKYGFVEYNGGIFLVAWGEVAVTANGLQNDPDHPADWYYCANGQVQTQFTGLAMYDDEWFWLENGRLDTTKNALIEYDGGMFYVGAGRLIRETNGLYQDPNSDAWYFIANGEVQVNYTGLAFYDGRWFYVVNGKLAVNYTGAIMYDGAEFQVINGMVA